jgi:hypothetical protein
MWDREIDILSILERGKEWNYTAKTKIINYIKVLC